MNSSNVFRSHLMQQFSAAARNQSRPPLAMMPWIRASHQSSSGAQGVEAEGAHRMTNHADSFNDISAIGSTGLSNVSSPQHQQKQTRSYNSGHNDKWSSVSASGRRPSFPRLYLAKDVNVASSKSLSSVAAAEDTTNNGSELLGDEEESDPTESDSDPHANNQPTALASNLQTLIQTRRTTSHFATNMHADRIFWEQALDRAAACGR